MLLLRRSNQLIVLHCFLKQGQIVAASSILKLENHFPPQLLRRATIAWFEFKNNRKRRKRAAEGMRVRDRAHMFDESQRYTHAIRFRADAQSEMRLAFISSTTLEFIVVSIHCVVTLFVLKSTVISSSGDVGQHEVPLNAYE